MRPAPPFSPELARREVVAPVASFIKPFHSHYFSRTVGPPYRKRQYSFAGLPGLMPLVRAFLDTSAAERCEEYQFLFTLLGSELANNAIVHSRSSERGSTYRLTVDRRCPSPGAGGCPGRGRSTSSPSHPTAATFADIEAGTATGRGLALIDALADRWGDNGDPKFRQVWFFLAYDLTDNPWMQIDTEDTKTADDAENIGKNEVEC
ncbi:ATP-binding protein [Nocardiopsis sp. NPDC006938]|uniref:ATP-binding protein n=1 Tax=Nocardiopsis sp. NPDC006938 TaxID=3364337 RepID=UPI0036D13A9F